MSFIQIYLEHDRELDEDTSVIPICDSSADLSSACFWSWPFTIIWWIINRHPTESKTCQFWHTETERDPDTDDGSTWEGRELSIVGSQGFSSMPVAISGREVEVEPVSTSQRYRISSGVLKWTAKSSDGGWDWFEYKSWNPQLLRPSVKIIGPINKEYRYILSIKNLTDVWEKNIFFRYTIVVHGRKQQYARSADSDYSWWRFHSVIANAWSPIPFIGGVIAGAHKLIADGYLKMGNQNRQYAEDPIEYDPDYIESYGSKSELSKYHHRRVPRELSSLQKAMNTVFALHASINVTQSRFMSALKHGRKRNAGKHKTNAIRMLSKMDGALADVQEQIKSLRTIEKTSEFNKAKAGLPDAIERVRKEGFPESEKEDLMKQGFTPEQIGELESELRKLDAADAEEDIYPKLIELLQKLNDFRTLSEKAVKEMDRIHSLSDDDIRLELYRVDLLSGEEFWTTRNPRTPSNYLLVELTNIPIPHTAKLLRAGISSTNDLLRETSTQNRIRRLSKKLDISTKELRKIVGWTELLQVSGIGQGEAEFLERIGCKNIDDLAKSDSVHLHSEFRARKDLHKHVHRVPAPATLRAWKKRALVKHSSNSKSPVRATKSSRLKK
ncbi:MAG: DUF4332 domain-containing protein [Candidatus Thorarchaeota archaeon]|jgi:hypothetical protein